jgi:hypothetical protein
MATKIENKSQAVATANQLLAGAAKRITGTTPLMLMGSPFTPAEITAKLQSFATLRSDVDAAKAQTKGKLALEAASMPTLRPFMSAFVAYVKAAYAGSPDALADFGIHPKSRVPLTVEAKAAATAKRAATRAARHTMGTKQKMGVKGDVTGVIVTPITAPPAVTPPGNTATPSPSAPATRGRTPVTSGQHGT